jgi:hypothetical protein
MATLKDQPVEYNRVYNQIRELKAKNVQDLATLDRQAAADAKKEALEDAKGWKDAFGEIKSAESTLVQNMISGRQTMTQTMLQIGSNFLQKELTNDLQYMTARLFYTKAELAADKSLAQGGLGVHLFTEQAKNAATAAGEAQRTVIVTAGAEAQGAAEGGAAKASIAKHAASAAAAVFDDVAQIPYVGWILAPVAAGAAFAGVMAYDALVPSFDVGAFNLPSTGLARVHAGETILPADGTAQAFRQAVGGGSGFGGTLNFSVNLSAIDLQTGAQFLKAQMPTIARQLQGYLQNNPSARPSY